MSQDAEVDEIDKGPSLYAHGVPATRLRADGSWVARFAGLDLEGTGATEGEAKRELVAAFTKWVFIQPNGKEELRAFLDSGGSEDVTVTALGAVEAEQLKSRLGRGALGLEAGEGDD